ncbi:hypothetical protein ACLOJK_029083 [Asimina triloba]
MRRGVEIHLDCNLSPPSPSGSSNDSDDEISFLISDSALPIFIDGDSVFHTKIRQWAWSAVMGSNLKSGADEQCRSNIHDSSPSDLSNPSCPTAPFFCQIHHQNSVACPS